MMRILVATDGSRGGNAAVRAGCQLAKAIKGSQITVVTVGTIVRDIILGTGGVPFPFTALPELQAVERQRAKALLARARKVFEKAGLRVSCDLLLADGLRPVAQMILREADLIKADMIVVGNEGRGAIREVALGSVALRLVNRSRRPVLVVRPARRNG